MRFNEAWKNLQTEAPFCKTNCNPMFDIDFENLGMIDETQFTVYGYTCDEKQCRNELKKFWIDFCKENDLQQDGIVSITYVGRDMEI